MESESSKKNKAVINNIRTIRESKQYSQEYVAAKLSISQNAYSKIELGRSLLSVERLLIIAEILEVEVTVLLSGNPAESLIATKNTKTKQAAEA